MPVIEISMTPIFNRRLAGPSTRSTGGSLGTPVSLRTSQKIAVSRTVRVSTPSTTPRSATYAISLWTRRPREGFSPTRPQQDAGWIELPLSLAGRSGPPAPQDRSPAGTASGRIAGMPGIACGDVLVFRRAAGPNSASSFAKHDKTRDRNCLQGTIRCCGNLWHRPRTMPCRQPCRSMLSLTKVEHRPTVHHDFVASARARSYVASLTALIPLTFSSSNRSLRQFHGTDSRRRTRSANATASSASRSLPKRGFCIVALNLSVRMFYFAADRRIIPSLLCGSRRGKSPRLSTHCS
jgi:hypothetical protein